MKSLRPLPTRRHAQRGATLIVTLVMLVLITLVGVSAVRSSTIDEKMAGNTRDRDRALQAAEAAIRQCLTQLKNTTYGGTKLAPSAYNAAPNWEANWTDSNSTEVTVDTKLASQPRCMVEELGSGSGNYRVTGRAAGSSALTEVILQATYTAE